MDYQPGPYAGYSNEQLREVAHQDSIGVFNEKTERNQRVQAGRDAIRRMHERIASHDQDKRGG